MKVQKVAYTNQYNQNFESLHCSRSFLNEHKSYTENMLLNQIKGNEFTRKYDVLIEKGKTVINKSKTMALAGILASLGLALNALAECRNGENSNVSKIVWSMGGAAILGIGGSCLLGAKHDEKFLNKTYKIQCGSGIKKNVFGQRKLIGSKSNVLEFKKLNEIKYISSLYDEVETKEEQRFSELISKKDSGNINTIQDIYELINDFGSVNCMNYSLDEKNNTLLAKFFDNKSEDSKEYKKIIKMLESSIIMQDAMDGSNRFDILNNIIKNKNIDGMKILENINILYSDDLVNLNNKISDDDFNQYFSKLNIDFSDWVYVLNRQGILFETVMNPPNLLVENFAPKIIQEAIEEYPYEFVSQLIEFIPNAENKEHYVNICKIVKNLNNVNYNEVDKSEISLVEKVLNSENDIALDLLTNVKIDYDPYLDYVYNNIQNESFKSKAKQLNVQLPREVFNIFSSIEAIQDENVFQLIANIMNSPFRKPQDIYDIVEHISHIHSVSDINKYCRPVLRQFNIWSPQMYNKAINEIERSKDDKQ